MEKREEALREALLKNSDETERWESYKRENESAIQNLQEFSKHLSLDVMVPVGSKAFMPGQLMHTNEVLVGHYQGYFSKCSAHKATEICQMRIGQAEEQLKKLQTEAEFWQNKLDKPYLEGVIPNAEEREIIEDYDEEEEKRWREEHKIKVKHAKLKEKQEREMEIEKSIKLSTTEVEKSDEDIFRMLEEAELMEELEKELDTLEVDEINDETIRKLMAGEMEPFKEKPRTAHESKPSGQSKEDANLTGVIKKNAAKLSMKKPPLTNNNTLSNPEIQISNNEDSVNNDDEELTEEVRLVKDQAQFLPSSDQVGFYEYQVEIIRKKVANLRLTKESDIDEKLHLLTVQAELEDLLALAEEEAEFTESEVEDNMNIVKEVHESKVKESNSQKRRISFALENETLLFRHTEAVSQMLPKICTVEQTESSQRDVITLDNDDCPHKSGDQKVHSPQDKKQSILEKVERNLEHQKEANYDLVTKIIDEATSTAETIYITFKHSDQEATDSGDLTSRTEIDITDENFIPGKPSDFYHIYLKQLTAQEQQISTEPTTIYVNGYIGEENVKAPILKEANREISYEDPRAEFWNPKNNTESDENAVPTKSILRNKAAVEQETHIKDQNASKKHKKKKASFDEEEYMSAYYKVMNDVVEKPLTEPEPLPQEKFINAHTPKKRISRFKQLRSEMDKT